MGNVIDFCGSLETRDEELVAGVLGAWLGVGLRPRIRLLGWEVRHAGEGIEVFAQEAVGFSSPCTLVSGTAEIGPDEAHALFGALHARCAERGLGHTLEYQVTGADGEALDDETHILAYP